MRLIFVAIPLVLILIASLWFAGMAWTSLGGAPMPVEGYYAMIGGVIFSLLIGCGLMVLVFYSHRRGYDDAAGGEVPRADLPGDLPPDDRR